MAIVAQDVQCEVQDKNYAAGYVTYIVDLWQGSATDPAVGITRWLGLWHESVLLDSEFGEPDWAEVFGRGYMREPKPNPLIWAQVEIVKEADDAARLAARNDEDMMEPVDPDQPQYRYINATKQKQKTLYQAFIAAIDRLAQDDTDAEAWAAIDAWRDYNAKLHEK